MTAITSLSASAIAQLVRAGALSPVDVVEAHIARIEATHAALNAVVIPTFEYARQQARQATAAVEQGAALGPLHGVPFTAKDSLDVAGVRSTCGLVARADHIPAHDAVLVERMRSAGAILLGKTNTPDNCGDYETHNLLFGLTNNPWDVTRTVGGSTGGEGAIIAAGGSPLGLGSDIAGSIRLPCHFNGIVGLRPTSATLPGDGQWPPSSGRLADMEAPGPMARRVEDVALAFDVLRGVPPQPLNPDALRGERVAFWYSDGTLPGSGAIRGGVAAAVAALREAGMEPIHSAPAARRMASTGWCAYIQANERQAWAQGFGNGEVWSPLTELLRSLRGEPRIAPGSLLAWLMMHAGGLLAQLLNIDGVSWREELRSQLERLIGARGVAVSPVFPFTAPHHGWTRRWLAAATTSSYTMWVNLAGLPGLTVPVGRSARSGLPVGVQLVGVPGSEQTLLAAGLVVQRALMPEWRGPLL